MFVHTMVEQTGAETVENTGGPGQPDGLDRDRGLEEAVAVQVEEIAVAADNMVEQTGVETVGNTGGPGQPDGLNRDRGLEEAVAV